MGEDGNADWWGGDWMSDPGIWGGMAPEQGVLSGGGKLGVGDWYGLEPGYAGEQSQSLWRPESSGMGYAEPGTGRYIAPQARNFITDQVRATMPNSYTPGSGNYGGASSGPMWGANQPTGLNPLQYSGGGGGGGPRGLAAQSPSTISMGAPERTMYDLYTKMLKNPEQLAENPAYKFILEQGQQALERSNAAKHLRFSGKSLADSTAYGEGMASDFANRMLPQYQAGAQSELSRFMGPAGLLPQYQQGNNAAIGQAGAAQGAQDMMPFYQQMMARLARGGNASSYSQPPMPTGPSYGGVRGGYNAVQPRLEEGLMGGWNPSSQDNTMFSELGI